MTVYAVQEPRSYNPGSGTWSPRVNINAAQAFGDVVTLIPFDHVNAALLTVPTMHKLRKALKDFNDEDYILPVGDITLVAMATAVAMRENLGRAKLLRWNRNEKRYDVVEVQV